MKLIVNPHKIEIDKSPVNEREIDITKCEFEFADEITNDYVKEAYFTFNGTSYKEIIVNNQCAIPNEVLAKKGQVEIGVVAFLVENEEEIKRYNPSPAYFNTWLGSLKDNAENSEPITPSEMEQFEQALNDGLNEVANVDIDAEQLDNGMSVTITNRYGEDKTVYAYDGEKGETGATPNIQIGTVVTGDHSEVTRTGTNENPIFNFILEKGDKGDTGNGIASVTKTSTSGLVDTYTITYTNGTTTDFDVTNGKSITNIAKTSTSGLEDTYTITYNDNTTSTFTVTNGNGISSIEKTGTQGNVDTYTIYYTNGTTSTFTVTNSTVTNQEFEELKAEHEELVNTLPRVEGTGESITLDNTAQYKMNVALNPSELSQTTYTGRNLANFETISYDTINAGTASRSGQEYTVTASDNNKWSSCRFSVIDIGLKLNTTYTFSALIKSTTSSTGSYVYVYSGATSTGTSFSGNKASAGNRAFVTFTTPSSWGSSSYQVGLLPTEAGATTVFTDIMIEESATMGEYEPYVGGVPSPSPDYPQDIHIVSGDNEIRVCNKNLLNITTTLIADRTNNGITTKVNDNQTITISGTASSTARYFTSDDNNKIFLKAGTYKISTNSTMPVRLSTKKISGATQLVADTFTIDEDFYIYNGRFNLTNGTTYNETIWIQLEKSSTATDYVEHKEYTKEINLGVENLFDKTDIETGKYYKTSAIDTSSNWAISQVKVQPNTNYYLSGNNYNNNTAKIVLLDSSKNILSSVGGYYDTHLITTSSTTAYIGLSIAMHEGVDDLNTIQLEKGSKANSYTPYGTTPIEVGGIGTYEDEFFKNTTDSEYYDSTLELDKWYLKNRIGKVVLDGSESWLYASSTNYYYLDDDIFPLSSSGGAIYPALCNYYLSSKYDNLYDASIDYGFAFGYSRHRIIIRNKDITSLSNFKNWLSTHNTDVYYVLATPTNTLLNDTLQETLDSFYSWQEQTNISQENNDLPFVIKASAIYDLTNLVNRVATLETE